MTFSFNPGGRHLRGWQKNQSCFPAHKEGDQSRIFRFGTAAHLRARPGGGLAHAQDRLVLHPVQPAGGQPGAADPRHHGDVAVSEESVQKKRHAGRIEKAVERVKREQWRGGEQIIKVPACKVYYLALKESGGNISRVWAGPYRFTTNRLIDGMFEPACQHKRTY